MRISARELGQMLRALQTPPAPRRPLIMLPVVARLVASDATTVAVAETQVELRPRRLVVSPSCAAGFEIVGIQIGNQPQFAAYTDRGALADIFLEQRGEDGRPLDNLEGLPTISPAQQFSLTVRNVGPAAATFSSMLFAAPVRSRRFRLA